MLKVTFSLPSARKKKKEKKKRNASNGEWHSLAGFTAVIDSCVSSCYLSVWSSVGRQLTEHFKNGQVLP